MDITREVEFFDRFEEEHGDYDVLGRRAYERLLGLFAQQVRPRPGEEAIDLGCGSGAFTRRLGQRFNLKLTGMDIAPRLVARAQALSGTERYVVGDITSTGLPDASFDIIVYSGVLHHCDERSTRVRILREGLRLLRPGGRMFSYDPSWHSPSMWLYRDPASPLCSKAGKTENEILLRRDDFAQELRDAGYTDFSIRGVSGITYRWVDSPLARLFLPLYNLYEQVLRYSPFENRFGTFLVAVATRQTCARSLAV